MKELFKGWNDWMVVIFLMTLLVLIPLVESSVEQEHPEVSNQAVLLPRNFRAISYHGHEENKQVPELALARPAIVGTASLPSTSFFPVYTMSNPKYGFILSNVSLPSVITSGSISS